jgi:hypothetical protein
MNDAEKLAILFSGIFFLIGLLSGIWKYIQIHNNENGKAHIYVDICHRASLLYAFASILLAKFAEISKLSNILELFAMALVLFYFSTAIVSYIIHGLLKDTNNQLKPPYQMGKLRLSAAGISFYMWGLIVGEISGFLILFYGVLVSLW